MWAWNTHIGWGFSEKSLRTLRSRSRTVACEHRSWSETHAIASPTSTQPGSTYSAELTVSEDHWPAIASGTRYAAAATGRNATEVQRRWVRPIQANVMKKNGA